MAWGTKQLLSSLVNAVLMLVDIARENQDRLKRMEHNLSKQSDALASIVDSLVTNFANLDGAIQNLVAAQASADTPDPAIQASIDKLTGLSSSIQSDLTKLAPAAQAASTVASALSTDAAASPTGAEPAPGKMAT